jgi:putative hydrolase of the HAD superfamily
VKHQYTEIADEVSAVVSSHDYGLPKEHPGFWLALNNQHGFTPANSLFVDDNIDVLDAARLAGIGHLLCVATPDSARPARTDLGYPCFDDFHEICALPRSHPD